MVTLPARSGLVPLLLFATASLACGSSPNQRLPGPAPADASPRVDSGVPADSGSTDAAARPDGGSTSPDAQPAADAQPAYDAQPAADARPAYDAGPIDASLPGTSLDGIQLAWTDPIDLCEVFREGGTLDDARQRQLHLTVDPAPRTTLEPAHLGGATLTTAMVRSSPFAAGQKYVPASAAVSRLVSWMLIGPPDNARVAAEIEHDLGAAGRLTEHLNVRRSTGDTAPVIYRGEMDSEVRFSYAAAAAGATPVALEVCGGPAHFEDAVVVFAGRSEGAGTDWVIVTRHQRTQLTVAGSSPVYPVQGTIRWSGSSRLVESIVPRGHFAHVYSAGHHNWSEHSRIDLDRDLMWHYFLFGPLSRGMSPPLNGAAIERVDLIDVNTPGQNGRAELVVHDVPSQTVRTERYDLVVDNVRVDDVELQRHLRLLGCTNPGVDAIEHYDQGGNYLFQLGHCPGTGPLGFDLLLLVPVSFPADLTQIGRQIGAADMRPATVSGQPGVEITAGDYRVRIARTGRIHRVEIVGAAGNTVASGAASFRPLLDGSNPDQALRGENATAGVSATLERRWVMQGAGNSGIYAPISFELTFGGRTHRVEAWDRMAYSNTHHNWDDTCVVESDELRMFWRTEGVQGRYHVRAERIADGQEVLAS